MARCVVCGRREPPEELVDHDGEGWCQECFEPEALPGSTTGGCGTRDEDALREARDEAAGERYIQGLYRAALDQVRHCAAAPGSMSPAEMQREIVSIVDSVIGPVGGPTHE